MHWDLPVCQLNTCRREYRMAAERESEQERELQQWWGVTSNPNNIGAAACVAASRQPAGRQASKQVGGGEKFDLSQFPSIQSTTATISVIACSSSHCCQIAAAAAAASLSLALSVSRAREPAQSTHSLFIATTMLPAKRKPPPIHTCASSSSEKTSDAASRRLWRRDARRATA